MSQEGEGRSCSNVVWVVPRLQYAGAVDLDVTQRALRYLHFPGEAVILLNRVTSQQWLQHREKHCPPASVPYCGDLQQKHLPCLSRLMISKGNEDPRPEDKSLCLGGQFYFRAESTPRSPVMLQHETAELPPHVYFSYAMEDHPLQSGQPEAFSKPGPCWTKSTGGNIPQPYCKLEPFTPLLTFEKV